MNWQDFIKLCHERCADAKAAGTAGPFVVILAEPGDNIVRLIAEHHPAALYEKWNSKLRNPATGELQRVTKFHANETVFDVWPLEGLLFTLGLMGAPPTLIGTIAATINDSCDIWLIVNDPENNAVTIGSFPEPETTLHRNLEKHTQTTKENHE